MQEKTVRIDEEGQYDSTPTYLFDYPDLYKNAPHEAGLVWFAESRYGLAVSFGVHSLLGKGLQAISEMGIQTNAYENLKDSFQASHFDAVDIVQFAVANGMRYVEFTVRGADGFCLWNTETTSFNCASAPAKRDLLAELASVCEYEGVGLCLRYSIGKDAFHPAGLEDAEYGDLVMRQLRELLENYGPVAAVNLDGLEGSLSDAARNQLEDAYKLIRILQPQILISCQHGITGTEDYFSALHAIPAQDSPEGVYFHQNKTAPVQIRDSVTPGHWSYHAESAGKHLKEEAVWEKLANARRQNANFLLNTNLMPDGSLDLEDINTLLAIGKKIQNKGFPA